MKKLLQHLRYLRCEIPCLCSFFTPFLYHPFLLQYLWGFVGCPAPPQEPGRPVPWEVEESRGHLTYLLDQQNEWTLLPLTQDHRASQSFRVAKQNAMDWVAYKQWKCILHSSGGWKSKPRVSAWFGSGYRLMTSSHGEKRARKLSGVLS